MTGKLHKSERFLLIILFSFVFIASLGFIINRSLSLPTTDVISVESRNVVSQIKRPPLPVFRGKEQNPRLSAQSILAVDLDSGVTLFQKNPNLLVLPASTTKIITGLVALEHYPLNKVLKVGKVNVGGQKMHLVTGEEMSVRDLIFGLLIYSANDAAEVLAENYTGGRDGFISAMNEKARDLRLEQTFFSNPTGLDTEGQFTTARDLVKVSSVAMQNPFFRKAVGTKEAVVKSVEGKFTHRLANINELLGEEDGVLGVKTGWTENAKENLVTYIERDGRKIMIAILASQDRFGETSRLIGWIFANFEWVNIL